MGDELGLRLGVGVYATTRHQKQKACLDFSLRLCTKEEFVEENDEEDVNYSEKNIRGRKKLKLSKEQSTLLENTFHLHTTLNPFQKQALAEQLNLKPRQVEVWFQNRRARTKLKQKEVDCEFLKKYCESLRNENNRLKKELEELQSPFAKAAAATAMTTITLCPLCQQKSLCGS